MVRDSIWEGVPNVDWGTSIWNKCFKPSMAIFNWRLIHCFLPTDDVLKDRGIPVVSKCHLCACSEETLEHIFVDCSYTAAVWKCCWSEDSRFQQFRSPITTWNFLNPNCRFALIFRWFIWISRNNSKHSDLLYKPPKLAALFHGFCRNQRFFTVHSPWKSRPKLLHWYRPNNCTLKINLDGSFNPSLGRAAIGGVFRNSLGECVLYFSTPIRASSALQAEYTAFICAARLALLIPDYKFWFETDSLQLVRDIIQEDISKIHWSVLYLHRYLLDLLGRLKWHCSHGYRETNRAADFLANDGMSKEIGFFGKKPNAELLFLLKNDLNPLPYIRFVGG